MVHNSGAISSQVDEVFRKWEYHSAAQVAKRSLIQGESSGSRNSWNRPRGSSGRNTVRGVPLSRNRQLYRTPARPQKVVYDGYRGSVPNLVITIPGEPASETHRSCYRCVPSSHGQWGVRFTDVRDMCHSYRYRRLGLLRYYFTDVCRCSAINISRHPDLADDVLGSRAVRNQIANYEDEQQATNTARQLYTTMAASSCSFIARIAGWLLLKIFRFSTSGIYVNRGELEVIKGVAANGNVPILYLPLHKSHLDYIILMFVLCLTEGIPSPFVAAGDNLNITLVGTFFRKLGAFFIRRKEGPDQELYKAIMGEYLIQLLKSGSSVEFFLEGRRSRTGLVNPTKVGLLTKIAGAVRDGVLADVLICPLSITFDKVYEESLTSELRGSPKVQENIMTALWETVKYPFRHHYGSIHVNFSEPFSLAEFMDQALVAVRQSDSGRSIPANLMNVGRDGMFQLATFMGDHILNDALEAGTINSPAILSVLLLNTPRQTSLRHLEHRGLTWRSVLMALKKPTCVVFKEGYMMEALKLLKGKTAQSKTAHLQVKDVIVVRNHNLQQDMLFSYYASPLVSAALIPSILCLMVLRQLPESVVVTREPGETATISRSKLIANSQYLYKVLSCTVRCAAPCASVEELVTCHLDILANLEILIQPKNAMSFEDTRRLTRNIELWEGEDRRSDQLHVNLSRLSVAAEIASLVAPYLDVMVYVLGVTSELPAPQDTFVSDTVCAYGEGDYEEGVRSALTASRVHVTCAVDCLVNVLKVFQKSSDGVLSLHPEYDRTPDFLQTVEFFSSLQDLHSLSRFTG